MIKLYGTPQSRALRSLWALEELGVPYELVRTNFGSDTRAPDFLKINPNGRVPALVDGTVTLFESMAINLYLAKKYDRVGLYPRDLDDEARAVQWSIWGMTEVEPSLLQLQMNRVFLPPPQRDESAARAAEERLGPPLRVLDGALTGRTHLLGDTFTIADLNVASVAWTAPLAKMDLTKTPNAERWLSECAARPALAKALKR